MDILSWVLFGLITGVVANVVDPYPSTRGALSSMVIGITGALVGGFLAHTLLGTGLNVSSLITAFVGSFIFLYMVRLLQKNRKEDI